eukprot:TRINITY_DN3114_c0_g1_i1.p1 TRINITY_DN3114_c0_g1~~TRINITY_DN3114_c0_g1_i1.p1  ORF type:complete len:466 (+),score=79.88 TRINITY_DN3114_c0_g1_i1:102-1499(+)
MVADRSAVINWLSQNVRTLIDRVAFLEAQLQKVAYREEGTSSTKQVISICDLLLDSSSLPSNGAESKGMLNILAPEFVPALHPSIECDDASLYFELMEEDIIPTLGPCSGYSGSTPNQTASEDKEQVFSEVEAATVIQRGFREWSDFGPLRFHARRHWIMSKALDFPGHPYVKSLLRKTAYKGALPFDPEKDLNAIQFRAACAIQRAWRERRASKVLGSPSHKKTSVMDSLYRMGGKQLPINVNTSAVSAKRFPKSTRRKYKRHVDRPLTSSAQEDEDAVLEEGLQLAIEEERCLEAAAAIQHAWRQYREKVLHACSDSEVSRLLSFSKADLDSLSPDCNSILQMAHLMSHLVSKSKHLNIEEKLLGQIGQKFLDDSVENGTSGPFTEAFPDCLRYLFGKSQQDFDTSQRATGSQVAHYFVKYLVHLRVSRAQQDADVTDEHPCIALACMFFCAKGFQLPEDIVI